MIDYKAMTPAERREFVTPLWLGGKSANEIANMMTGATRCAVMGVVNRAGLLKARLRAIRPPKPRPQRPARAAQAPRRPTVTAKAPPAPDPDAVDVFTLINTNRPPLPGIPPIPLIALPSRSYGVCRFPVIGGYCGLKCGEARFCPDHHRMMFNNGRNGLTPDAAAIARQKYQAERDRTMARLAGQDGE